MHDYGLPYKTTYTNLDKKVFMIKIWLENELCKRVIMESCVMLFFIQVFRQQDVN